MKFMLIVSIIRLHFDVILIVTAKAKYLKENYIKLWNKIFINFLGLSMLKTPGAYLRPL